MLVGLVKKNAIMMIDFALDAQRTEGYGATEAILEGCFVRFRPIMMTTMAAFMGVMPIAIGWGAGGESRRPLGMAVVGGLVVSQLLTLYITPVVYTYMDSLHEWVLSLRSRRQLEQSSDRVERRPRGDLPLPPSSSIDAPRAAHSRTDF